LHGETIKTFDVGSVQHGWCRFSSTPLM